MGWAEKGASGWSEWLRRPCRCDAVSRAAGIYVLSAITRACCHRHHTALIQMELSCSSPHTLTATLLLRRAWAEH